ncbi:MAG: hypothetical protein LUQ25_03960 [Methanoregulaceae archaeon]|nr:hypothetical protein [Methanoregulaceae archaeon]
MRADGIVIIAIAVSLAITGPAGAEGLLISPVSQYTPGVSGEWGLRTPDSGNVIDDLSQTPLISHPWSAGEHHLFTIETWRGVADDMMRSSGTQNIAGYGTTTPDIRAEDIWDRTIETAFAQSYGMNSLPRRD